MRKSLNNINRTSLEKQRLDSKISPIRNEVSRSSKEESKEEDSSRILIFKSSRSKSDQVPSVKSKDPI